MPKDREAIYPSSIPDSVHRQQAQADRLFLMTAWLDISKQILIKNLRDIATDEDAFTAYPTKVVEELKAKMKAGLFDA